MFQRQKIVTLICVALLIIGSLAFIVPSVHAETVQFTETYSEYGFSFKYPQGMNLTEGSLTPPIFTPTYNLGIVFGVGEKEGVADYTNVFMLSWNQTLIYDFESVLQSFLEEGFGETVTDLVLGERVETSVMSHNVIHQSVTIASFGYNFNSSVNVWYCDDSTRLIILGVTGAEVLQLSEDYLDQFYCHELVKISTTISCSVSQSEITKDDSITVSGSISPPVSDVIVTLTYTKPDSSTFTRTCTTNPGDYSDTYTPDILGSWSVNASWTGDTTHEGAFSSSKSFTVKEKPDEPVSGCLIATATYGSELTPQVKFLRGFRDNTVYTTFAGSNFMAVFNRFYYSFSPNVASVIADNSALRDIMKVILYPLIGILHVSSAAFSFFRVLPEVGIVIAGLIASSLIGIVYFLPLTVIIGLKKKFQVSEKIVRLMGLVLISSVLFLFLAEITKSPSMMMVSTGTFVLVTISTSTLTSLRIISKHLIH